MKTRAHHKRPSVGPKKEHGEGGGGILRLAKSLFREEEIRERFVASVTEASAACPGVIWTRDMPDPPPFAGTQVAPWQPGFVSVPADANESPGRHPLHKAGYYYCLDYSSVFAASALLAVDSPPEVVIDMCAAPGGKGIFAWRAFSPRLLVSNEVIGKRTGMLVSNLKRCGVQPCCVTRMDSQDFGDGFPSTAQLVIVDAPCSGQSLPAKGDDAPGAYHPVTINMNANRQRRILANVCRVVAPGGYLAYMTCTYARDENEGVVEWLTKRHPQLRPVEVPHLSEYRSHLAEWPCYRLWPFQGLGAGGFTCLLRNREEGETTPLDPMRLPCVWRSPDLNPEAPS